jgi:hypothetical protein
VPPFCVQIEVIGLFSETHACSWCSRNFLTNIRRYHIIYNIV